MDSRELERLNTELIKIRSSEDYEKGKNLAKVVGLLKHLRFIKLWKKMHNRKKIANLSHLEQDNNFGYERSKNKNGLPKIVVYTCITGGYDNLSDPFMFPENIDYVAFVDEDVKSKGWEIRKLSMNLDEMRNNAVRNRYVKFHPQELFGDEYDFAIYLDGNIAPVGDLTPMTYAVSKETGLALHRHRQRDSIYAEAEVCKIVGKGNKKKLAEQVKGYKLEGFPERFGLYECNVIVSDLRNKCGQEILEDWWDEYLRSQSGRDQIALPYVVWKRGMAFDKIGSLGDNVYRNSKILVAENTHEK